MRQMISALAIFVVMGGVAQANDSTAELATGGLVFTKTDNIEMRAEDLSISEKAIDVKYRFYNSSAAPVTTLVAFPMPDLVMNGEGYDAVPTQDPENLLGFVTTVDGQKVQARVEQKVFAKDKEQTALLREMHIPLAPHLEITGKALEKLSKVQLAKLQELGLIEVSEYNDGKADQRQIDPQWTLKTTYFWEQTFAPQKETLIDHHYSPSVGGTVGTRIGSPYSKESDADYKQYLARYCVDADLIKTVKQRKPAKNSTIAYSETWLSYILKTGANWAGPIKEFRLTIDKGATENLVSFCGEGVKKIAPTMFEMRKSDFTPKQDLEILILKPVNY